MILPLVWGVGMGVGARTGVPIRMEPSSRTRLTMDPGDASRLNMQPETRSRLTMGTKTRGDKSGNP